MTEKWNAGNIFANISNSYYHLTASEKKVADYVLSHKMDAQFMSISELAEACGVAEATVSRFCRRLKLRGYNAFKLALAKATAGDSGVPLSLAEGMEGEIRPEDSISDLCRKLYATHTAAVSQTMALVQPELICRAVDMITSSERIFCMGQGGSTIMAQEAAHLFSTASPRFYCVQDSHIQTSTVALMGAADLIIFFSYSGSTKDVVEVLAQAKECRAKTILVTRFSKSPGAALADVVLQCGSNEGPLQMGSVAARMAQLFLVDVLFNEFCRRNSGAARYSRERIAAALAEKHL